MPFSPSPYPNLFSGEGKKKKKKKKEEENTLYLKLKQNFISMIDEKAFADFIITGALIFSFGGF